MFVLFIGIAVMLVVAIRRFVLRIEPLLSDVTVLRFISKLSQVMACVISLILYAHLIPELRAFGTSLLAGVGIVSVVIGIAAQHTLGNLIAGLSLVIYRPFRIGDNVELTTPIGLVTGYGRCCVSWLHSPYQC